MLFQNLSPVQLPGRVILMSKLRNLPFSKRVFSYDTAQAIKLNRDCESVSTSLCPTQPFFDMCDHFCTRCLQNWLNQQFDVS